MKTMIRLTNIKPLTDFLRNSKAHIGTFQSSGEAEVLTVNGEASIVIQDAKSYQALLELADQARQDERLRQAMRAVENGELGEPLGEAFSRLRQKHDNAS
jgi:hypothetical protein